MTDRPLAPVIALFPPPDVAATRIETNLPPGARLDVTSLFLDVFGGDLAAIASQLGKEQDHALR